MPFGGGAAEMADDAYHRGPLLSSGAHRLPAALDSLSRGQPRRRHQDQPGLQGRRNRRGGLDLQVRRLPRRDPQGLLPWRPRRPSRHLPQLLTVATLQRERRVLRDAPLSRSYTTIESICQSEPAFTNLTVAVMLLVPNEGRFTVNKTLSCAVFPLMRRKPPSPNSEQSDVAPHCCRTLGPSHALVIVCL